MPDLAGKQARNDALRRELSALRVEKDAVLTEGHDFIHEQRLDADAARLQVEVETARAQRDEAIVNVTGGTVEDAAAAMRAAASAAEPAGDAGQSTETESDGGKTPLMTPVLTSAGNAEVSKDEEK